MYRVVVMYSSSRLLFLASEMTYTVSGGALNSTQSNLLFLAVHGSCLFWD